MHRELLLRAACPLLVGRAQGGETEHLLQIIIGVTDLYISH